MPLIAGAIIPAGVKLFGGVLGGGETAKKAASRRELRDQIIQIRYIDGPNKGQLIFSDYGANLVARFILEGRGKLTAAEKGIIDGYYSAYQYNKSSVAGMVTPLSSNGKGWTEKIGDAVKDILGPLADRHGEAVGKQAGGSAVGRILPFLIIVGVVSAVFLFRRKK